MKGSGEEYPDRFARVVESLLLGAYGDAEERLVQIAVPPALVGPARGSIPLRGQFAVFSRDQFTCRYCGRRTLFVPVLRLVSVRFPTILRHHPNWKMSETDVAFWREAATCDHVVPVARGGSSDIANLVTACYMCQSMKQNWLLDEIRWQILPVSEDPWNGLAYVTPGLLGLLGSKVPPGSNIRRWARVVERARGGPER